jgi:hypothetical protein
VSIARVEQGAEDRRLDVAPVGAGGLAQQAAAGRRQAEGR